MDRYHTNRGFWSTLACRLIEAHFCRKDLVRRLEGEHEAEEPQAVNVVRISFFDSKKATPHVCENRLRFLLLRLFIGSCWSIFKFQRNYYVL